MSETHGTGEDGMIPGVLRLQLQEGDLSVLAVLDEDAEIAREVSMDGVTYTLIPVQGLDEKERVATQSILDRLAWCSDVLRIPESNLYTGVYDEPVAKPLFLPRGGSEVEEIRAINEHFAAPQQVYPHRILLGLMDIPGDTRRVLFLIGRWNLDVQETTN
jgi:hypothetical protein